MNSRKRLNSDGVYATSKLIDDDDDYDDHRRRFVATEQKQRCIITKHCANMKGDYRPYPTKASTNTTRSLVETARQQQQQPKVVIVVDLDETLINKEYKPFFGMHDFLRNLRQMSEYMILWTAGNQHHATRFIEQLVKSLGSNPFDQVLSTTIDNRKSVANLRVLLPDAMLSSENVITILIDDNPHYLMSGGYDVAIDVTNFYINVDSTANYSINYRKILRYLATAIKKEGQRRMALRMLRQRVLAQNSPYMMTTSGGGGGGGGGSDDEDYIDMDDGGSRWRARRKRAIQKQPAVLDLARVSSDVEDD